VAAWWRSLGTGERRWLIACMLLAVVVRLAYVVATHGHAVAGDEPSEYDLEGHFFTIGHWWWSTTPYGIAHASMWKAPGYPLWVGLWYVVLGAKPDRVYAVQTLIGALDAFLAFVLARRLFGRTTAMVTAAVVALYPNVWQFEVRLWPESLDIALTTAFLVVTLDRAPNRRSAIGAGVLLGVGILVRPTAFFLLAPLAVGWVILGGWRAGLGWTAVAAATAALCVLPWTIRNYEVAGGFVPISVQDAALYGTFNDQAAHDPVYPWAWRAEPRDALPLLAHARSDPVLRSALQQLGYDYIAAHPLSLARAFFWNGLSRLWDVRRPGRVLAEVPFEGRTRWITAVGLGWYWLLAVLALAALWRERRRPALVPSLVALIFAASVVFTTDAGTRYRAPLEPLIVVLGCSTAVALVHRERTLRSTPPQAGADSPLA